MKLLIYPLIFIFAATITVAEEPTSFGSPPWQPAGKYTHPDIRESSGIVASQQFKGVYWTLNDSGNPAVLYATKRDGELIREIKVRGTRNIDWEALGIDNKGQLWIGDIGNNSRMRFDLNVVVVKEPNPDTDTEVQIIAKYPYRYPDKNVDAEGLFIADGVPYIISKEQSGAVLYRFPALKAGEKQVLERVGAFAEAKLVTGAGISEDGKRLAVCTYNSLWVYHGTDGNLAHKIQGKPWVLRHNFLGEAICFEGNNLYLTNEARDIYALPQFWYEKQWKLPPQNTQSAISLLVDDRQESNGYKVETYREAGIDIDGGHAALNPKVTGPALHQKVAVPYKNLYEISTILTRGPEYGHAELTVNGTKVGQPHDCYHPELIAGTLVTFGTVPLNQGDNLFIFKSVGTSKDATGDKLGVDSYQILHASPFVQRYMVLGPFSKTDANVPSVSSKNTLNLNETYKGVENKDIRWREAKTATNGMLNLRTNIGMNIGVVGYAVTYVYAPKAMDTVLLLGSDETVTVWLNGTEIHKKRVYRRITPDADTIPCQLKAGWNEVLCSVEQNSWIWALYMRFTDAEGVLKYSPQPEN